MVQLFKSEEKYRKKMQKIYKSTQDLQVKIQEKKTMKVEKQVSNKRAEDEDLENKLKVMMDKLR